MDESDYAGSGVIVRPSGSLFFRIESKARNPFVDFELFRNRRLPGRRFRIFC